MLVGYYATTTYTLKQIVQLTDSLLLLTLHAANPNSWSVDGPFAPDRSAILRNMLDEMYAHIIIPPVSSPHDIVFWVSLHLPEDV